MDVVFFYSWQVSSAAHFSLFSSFLPRVFIPNIFQPNFFYSRSAEKNIVVTRCFSSYLLIMILSSCFSYDLRQHGGGRHWSDDSVFGRRAQFESRRHPLSLTVNFVRPEDEGIYRCRVDFERGPSKTFIIKLNVVGKFKALFSIASQREVGNFYLNMNANFGWDLIISAFMERVNKFLEIVI